MILALAAAVLLECGACHVQQEEALQASRHARSARWEIFRYPLAKSNKSWCLSCHQTEGPGTNGLTCKSCHGVKGDPQAVLGVSEPSANARDAHKVVVTPRRELALLSCGRCHEFATPLPGQFSKVRYSTMALQATVSEVTKHAPNALCSTCHDPHLAKGGHDEKLLRSVLEFSARVDGDRTELTIVARGVAHRFPTGDPFRRLVVEVCEDESCVTPMARKIIGRSFALVNGVWTLRVDESLQEGERRILRFPLARAWRVWFYFGDPRYESKLPESEVRSQVAAGLF